MLWQRCHLSIANTRTLAFNQSWFQSFISTLKASQQQDTDGGNLHGDELCHLLLLILHWILFPL